MILLCQIECDRHQIEGILAVADRDYAAGEFAGRATRGLQETALSRPGRQARRRTGALRQHKHRRVLDHGIQRQCLAHQIKSDTGGGGERAGSHVHRPAHDLRGGDFIFRLLNHHVSLVFELGNERQKRAGGRHRVAGIEPYPRMNRAESHRLTTGN